MQNATAYLWVGGQTMAGKAANLLELEAHAKEKLPQWAFDYYAGGAGDEITLRENREAYGRLRLRYRVLVDVSRREMGLELFGCPAAMPILVAPTAFHRLAHPEGELATARAAGAAGAIMTLSSLSTTKLEEVARAAGGPLWFQLYVNKDRGFTRELVGRAEAAGYRAIMVTADTPIWGRRERDVRNGFHLPEGMGAVNLEPSHERSSVLQHEGRSMGQAFSWMLDPSLTWKDFEWLCGITALPVLVKGVCRPDDAVTAIESGAGGVVVSNHGGRQLDGAPATIEALPGVVKAVAGRVPVIVDGGIRRGTDVLKALALGAAAVQIGRPVLWGLAVDGEEGVRFVLEMLRHELDAAMALCGCPSLAAVTRDLVRE